MVHTQVHSALPTLEQLPRIPIADQLLITSPSHFQVEYTINPHMVGNIGAVDESEAVQQWSAIKDVYERLGIQPVVVPGEAGLPDMVFCANQTLPYLTPDGEKGVVISRMHATQRKPEVDYYANFFEKDGYTVRHLDEDLPGDFEGMGDALWHPGRYLLWGGHGFRTDLEVYHRLSKALNVEILALHLENPDFYHLDTCFCLLDETSVLIFPPAFDEKGLDLIRHYFPTIIEAPEKEALELFACNAFCPDGKHVVIQRGCTETNRLLEQAGFIPIEVETSEYLKSGGSVFCMKLAYW